MAVAVVFCNTAAFRINAMYMGLFPMAEHVKMVHGNTGGAGAENVILGKANKK